MAMVDPTRSLTSRRPVGPALDAREQKQIAEAASTKLAPGNSGATWAASSAIASVEKGDAVQASADVLRLTGETLKKSPAANNLAVSGNVISSINQAANGDAFAAAAQATAAVEKISPTLAKSPAAAVANAVVLGASPEKLKATGVEVAKSAKKALSPTASASQRTKAWLDLTNASYQLANLGRVVGSAGVKVGEIAVTHLGKVARFAKGATAAQGLFAKVATSPVGKALSGLNKWIPRLNVAGVVLSAKTAIDVFRNHQASTTSKTLAVGSLALAGASLWAGVSLGLAPFLGITAVSLLADVGLAQSRKHDREAGTTDAEMRARLADPVRGLQDLGGWLGTMARGTVDFFRNGIAKAAAALKGKLAPAA